MIAKIRHAKKHFSKDKKDKKEAQEKLKRIKEKKKKEGSHKFTPFWKSREEHVADFRNQVLREIKDTESKINQTKIFLRTEDPGTNKYGDQICYMAILQINFNPTPIYELDVEAQWTSAEFTKSDAELAIYTGNLGTETLKVDVWNGSWITVIPSLIANSWNNVSVTDYLNSSTFTIS